MTFSPDLLAKGNTEKVQSTDMFETNQKTCQSMSKLLLFTVNTSIESLNPEPLDSASGSSGTFADFSMYITAEAAESAFEEIQM